MLSVEDLVTDIENPEQYFRNLVDDESKVNIIGMLLPPRYGVMLFVTSLEYGLFHPDNKEKNDQFLFHLNTFQGLKLFHVTIPKEYLEDARALALECDLRLVNSPLRSAGGMIIFCSKEPIEGTTAYPHFNLKTCYVLENIPGSKIYTASAEEQKKMFEEERGKADDIVHRRVKVKIPKLH